MNKSVALIPVRSRLLVAAVFLSLVTVVLAVPFHTPTIDGIITGDGLDWDSADLVVDDIADDDLARTANTRRLWLTWDQDNLYVGVTYQDFGANEALSVFFDLDRGLGPNSAAVIDSAAGNFLMPQDHRFELVLRRGADEGFPGFIPRAHLISDDTGASVGISGSITRAQGFNSSIKSTTRFPFWLNGEFALPWSAIYPDLGGQVPAHAVIKAVAVATSAADSLNGLDSAPSNDGLDGGLGTVILSNLHASVIDADGNGVPDAADATISGTTTLPQDAGTATVTVVAELIDFAGRAPGTPLSVVTTTAGQRNWTLPRLSAGRYRITTSAVGYFANTVTVDVAQSQQVIGTDQTLDKATSIGGAISFASGPGADGSVELRDASGTVLDSAAITAAGGPYLFFIETGGDYVVAVSAATYLDAETPLTVTAGADVTGLDFDLLRQTEINGSIAFDGGPGQPGTLYFRDEVGNDLDFTGFPSTGGNFQFFTPVGGTFTLSASTQPAQYVPTDTTFVVTAGEDIAGLVITLPLAAQVSGTMAFEGPDAAGQWQLFDNFSGAFRDSLSFAATGDPFSFFLEPGEFRLEFAATGYQDRTLLFNVTEADTSLGAVQLTAVRATHLEIVNDEGETLPEIKATFYNPDEDPWTSSRVLLAARDDDGLDDLYDLDNNLSGFKLSARKMDDISATTGTPVFYLNATEAAVDSIVSFADGRGEFYMSNTAVEVLRVYLAQPAKDPIAGRIVVAFQDPQPTTVVLTGARDTLVADATDAITITAQLYDSAGNLSLLPDIPVSFGLDNGSTGNGQFEVPTTLTNGTGLATGRVLATGAGSLLVTASVVIENRVLNVESGALGSGEPLLALTSIAGATSGWRLSLPSSVSDLNQAVTVTGQLVDIFGNDTAEAGQTIVFSADPPELGTFAPVSAVSDADGRAVSTFTPSGTSGLVTITGDGGGLSGDNTGLQLRAVTVIPDPVWYEEPLTRQTFDKTDLTALVVDNTPDELILELPFQSDFDGMQLHLLFETNFDAAGATRDPFEQPVNYGHDNLPDYALTSKYSVNDYGDFRRWDPTAGAWEFWDLANDVFTGAATDQNIQPVWVSKEADRVVVRMPWTPFGGAPDSLRFEAYLTQEDGVKRSAFDSAPQDSTLNLTFDYNDPGPTDWDIALGPVTLVAWGNTYVVKSDFPTPPTVESVTAEPAELQAGELLTLTALVTNAGDGIGDVLADLSAMGGGALTRMYDDGNPSHGDIVAGDGVYSLITLVPLGNPGGNQDLLVLANDGANIWPTTAAVTINVTAIVEPLILLLDPVGDDHGPNQPGSAKKFTTYPTNIAFVPGAFDIHSLTVFETVANVGGEQVEMIAFQVKLGDFPDPNDPGTANWSPLYADLNIEKIDILIDSGPGGSTATLPNRQAAFQPWDAWDYAIVMDGWYKALIPSLGQNTVDSWRDNALRSDKDIILLGDPELDTVTALISKAALGEPTAENIRSWDMVVCISSHDFGGEEVLGGIRWVNEGRSEWNFGGGQNGDRDSNLIDLLLVPGTGHNPGLTQEEILDYESPDALDRLDSGLTPVAIEMSQFEDTGPPVIDTGGEGSVVTKVAPLEEAPLALTIKITDDFRVDRAEFRYRSTGFTGDGWERIVPMGFLGRDQWVVDILPSFLDSLVVSPIDSTRYLEFEVWATDPLDKTTTSPVTTLEVGPFSHCRPEDATLETENLALLQVDGSALVVPEELRGWLISNHIKEAWPGGEVSPDTMGAAVELQWDVCNIPAVTRQAPTVPPGKPVGIFRQVFLATSDTLGGYFDYQEKLAKPMNLSLHFPQAWLPAGTDKNTIAMYEYHPESDRWVLIGGNVSLTGNNVTAAVQRAGIYGLFRTDAVTFDSQEVLSGIITSPNPFSPNGDGLYDEVSISFYLTQEAAVTVEVYNIYGDRKNILTQTFSYSGSDLNDTTPRRVPGLVWDGRDFKGDVVPYGIYVLRIIATYNQAGGVRTIRSNHSVAVIK
ncbi:MAG: glucodextranase DOMON-like domain-containing protein [Candidatus Krumholzibacteria bacterium]|nr:glucodextranase DOMON-like domain-containing protein [Candidatus Krumholzibacteria bacterium]